MKNPENMTMMFFKVMWDDARYASIVPQIDADSNKYTRGSVAVVGGSARYTGAPIMAARAASRTGAGYTTLVVPAQMEQTARSHVLSIPVVAVGTGVDQHSPYAGYVEPDGVMDALASLRHLDAVVAGPGMGSSPAVTHTISRLLTEIEAPLVLDADALNAISGIFSRPDGAAQIGLVEELAERSGRKLQTVLTPHEGELARLAGACRAAGAQDVPNIVGADTKEIDAVLVSGFTGAVVVAKGPTTLVVSQARTLESANGTPALAKAGTGDVLAGMIGSLVAQRLDAFEAAALGVHVHSLAGVCAEESLGTASVMAEDVIEAIPEALARAAGPSTE